MSITLGRPTYSAGEALRLDIIEGSPTNRSVKVFPIVIAAMVIYAKAINARAIRVMNPINDEVKKYYESRGFTYVKKGDYLVRTLEEMNV